MEYPYIKLVLPKELEKVENGKLSTNQLTKVKCGGLMWSKAAHAFNAMFDAATKAGVKLQNIGDYRPFEAQFGMFKERYSTKDEGRKPQVTRTYDGKTWYLKPGMAPSSSPGKSNHGLGLAIDLNVTNPKTAEWLCKNAPDYGFYLQGSDPKSPEFELWHWQYCLGDKTPKALEGAPAPAGEVQEVKMRDKITVGAKGEDVKALQNALTKAGYYSGPISGDFDAATGEAVKKLKVASGLNADAVAGAKVFAILDLD